MNRITIIVPAYNEANNLRSFHKAVSQVIDELDSYQWRILFVDDGSRDNTWQGIEELSARDERVVGIRLSRNFGKEIALWMHVKIT